MKGRIEAHDISKRFVLSAQRPTDLREALSAGLSAWRRGASEGVRVPPRELWALRDVSFTVEPGTALGIVGHNGSGKSTLLKLLTGVLKPTTGSLRAQGRISALLELGAGFHPDLTGRENIFLNGSILGVPRREIARKFDAIVDFAGLERFVDTPVKRYSSGMFMRLGFSIAAHVEPDILLIDEVLAVGDQQFQNKCLRRMREFLAGGGTVVFVSHAMDLVAQLCGRCLWLDRGRLLFDGPTPAAVERYLEMVAHREDEEFRRTYPQEWEARQAERRAAEEATRRAAEEEEHRAQEARREREEARRREDAARNDPARSCLLGAALLDAHGQITDHFRAGEPMTLRIAYRLARPRRNAVIGFEICRSDGLYMFAASNYQYDLPLSDLPLRGEIELHVPFLSLNEGAYRFRLSLFPEPGEPDWDLRPEHVLENAATFTVSAGALAHGCAFVPVEWRVRGDAPRALVGAQHDPFTTP